MKNDISNVMCKLTGAELGRLFIKDEIGIMAGITRTYSRDDFDIATNKMERAEVNKYLNYWHLSKELMIICLGYRDIVNRIEMLSFKINWFRFYVSNVEMIETSRQLLMVERLKNHCGDDPGKHEDLLRDSFITIRDELLDSKEEISQIYDTLKYGITLYFVYKELIKALSDRLNLPELEAVISDDPLFGVELINLLSMELAKDNPCKELFQAIDIDELKKIKQFDVEKKVDDLMTWLK